METTLADLPTEKTGPTKDKRPGKLTDDVYLIPGVVVASLVAQQLTGTQFIRSLSSKHLGSILGAVGVQAFLTGILFLLTKYFHDCFLT